jgi:hypothetical protein
MTIKFNRKRSLVLALVAALAISAAAIAYWTTTGKGSVTGVAGDTTVNTDLKVIDTVATGPSLTPGGAGKALTGTIKNEIAVGGATLGVSELKATIAAPTQTAAGVLAGTCTVADYAFDTAAGSGWVIAGNVATYAYSPVENLAPQGTKGFSGLTLKMVNNSTASQNGCKGATANVNYDVS